MSLEGFIGRTPQQGLLSSALCHCCDGEDTSLAPAEGPPGAAPNAAPRLLSACRACIIRSCKAVDKPVDPNGEYMQH